MTVSVLQGDALAVLKTLPSEHFHCAITSPPYWGLRSYIADGDLLKPLEIGLEETPEAWCARLVDVFREVRRVLRADGCCFVNLGDSYCSGTSADRGPGNLKPKDLVGQPWMLAFALRADGWWLRSEIIWAKPNPMPESVTDRPTKSHEQVFLLTKNARYFWDAEAVREKNASPPHTHGANATPVSNRNDQNACDLARTWQNPNGRNLRSVWMIATDPLPSVIVDGEKLDHFASYPIELASRCILAGTSAKGCCPECGAPWARVVERTLTRPGVTGGATFYDSGRPDGMTLRSGGFGNGHSVTTGWSPMCSCPVAAPIPTRVLDPFGGSGRTALAAEELGRYCTLIELSPKSCAMAKAQIERAKARRMIGDMPTRAPADPRQGRLL